jgi:hypothetical protein
MWVFEATSPGAAANAVSTIAVTPATNNGRRSTDLAVGYGSWIDRNICLHSVRGLAARFADTQYPARAKTLAPVVLVGSLS